MSKRQENTPLSKVEYVRSVFYEISLFLLTYIRKGMFKVLSYDTVYIFI